MLQLNPAEHSHGLTDYTMPAPDPRRDRPLQYILIGRLAVPCTDLLAWARWFETADRHVAKTHVGPLWVSTVFLGIDHNFAGGDAILFETMIFNETETLEQTRCRTWDEAERQHAEAVEHATTLLAATAGMLQPHQDDAE